MFGSGAAAAADDGRPRLDPGGDDFGVTVGIDGNTQDPVARLIGTTDVAVGDDGGLWQHPRRHSNPIPGSEGWVLGSPDPPRRVQWNPR